MAGVLAKKDYPIAYVTLYKGNTQISETKEIRSGATSFKFDAATQDAIDRGLVVTETVNGETTAKLQNGNILLPKYDEYGRRIEYTMKEKPINGYISKIEQGSQKLINEYNGGRKLKFTVNKAWAGMENQNVYPTIQFTLHQIFRVEEGEDADNNPIYKYYEFNHFEREVKITQDSEEKDFSVTFGDDAHPDEAEALRYYSPIGEPYKYFITETLSNYDGEQAIFITNEDAEWIPEYLSNFTNNAKAIIIPLETPADSSYLTGQALGFTSQVTSALDSAEDAARAAAIESIQAENDNSYIPTEDEIQNQIKKELSNRTADALNVNETVKNTYRPDNSNFHGIINISKDWDTKKDTNTSNSIYDDVKAYTFTLSRKTKQLGEETLFTIRTKDTHSENKVPEIEPATGFAASEFRPSVTQPNVTAPAEGETAKYYIAIVEKGSVLTSTTETNAITVIVDVANDSEELDYHNSVLIQGLAVYGFDALKYYYT